MRRTARLVLAIALSLVVTVGLPTAVPASAATWTPSTTDSFDPATDLDEFESRILVAVNRIRARKDLPRVRVFQSCVDGYAERWAQRLKRREELVHRDLDDVLDGCNINWVGENLVRGTALTPQVAVRAWMDSPPHRRVLLKPRASWAGIGVRVDDGMTYAVLNFGDRT